MRRSARVCFSAAAIAVIASPIIGVGSADAAASATSRVSVSSGESQGYRTSENPSLSANGRYVAFSSLARNLVPGDTNQVEDVFVRDRWHGTTLRVSLGANGGQGNGTSSMPSISADGRYVAFMSSASNLVANDTNDVSDIFVRDLAAGKTRRLSVSDSGAQADGASSFPSISGDGLHIAFQSAATNLVPGDTNDAFDVFIRDRLAGATRRLSTGRGGQGDGDSLYPAVSDNGRFVAFISDADDLVAGDTNAARDAFVRDRLNATTRRVSVSSSESEANNITVNAPSISGDGRFVAFDSSASNLVVGDQNGVQDIFVRDLWKRTTGRVSVAIGGAESNGISISPTLSRDGRYVAFSSDATNLVPDDTNRASDVFITARWSGATRRASVGDGGLQADGASFGPVISRDGTHVAFVSAATNLVNHDTNGVMDVFMRSD